MDFYPQEIYTVQEDEQTDITLNNPYTVGTGSLMVFLNGALAVEGQDYIEVDSLHIQFTEPLYTDDVIVTRNQMSYGDKIINVIGRKRNSLFQTKGTVERLMPNHKYTMRFEYDNQTFSSSFYTVLDPLYSNISLIRTDLGDIASDVDDKRMLLLIYENSILSQNIASEENLELLATEEKTPYVFKQFVRYRTELDIMTAIYLALTGRGGSDKRVLGQMNIERRRELGMVNIDVILSDLRAKLKEWEKKLRGGSMSSPLVSAVKGGSSYAYPLTSPRNGDLGNS